MNEPDRIELAQLKEQHKRLEAELQSLSLQLKSFEDRVKAGAAAEGRATQTTQAATPPSGATSVSSVAATAVPVPSLAIPPVISQARPSISVTPTATNPMPGAPAQAAAASTSQPHLRIAREASAAPSVPKLPVSQTPPSLPHTPQQAPKARSLEMEVGTYWLVRIGVVMVLTGLVFFGNLAYQNYISRLGPGGKVCLLYLVSAVMLGGGWWWQRKAVKESLRNYAQVLFAGGLAGAYFTTYAAHHLERLRVIGSASVDGLLLLGCAAFMIWAAERKRSEVLAFFAVGLAYYTSIITHVGHFTLWSNLVLSAASVFFLVRNRWAALSFGSLIATYASYAYWRFFDGAAWHWASPGEGLWSGACFLMLYWLVFTSAVFLSREKRFAGPNRATFLTLNNGAFFTLFLLTMLQVQQGGFWKFSLVYGGILLALSLLANRWLAAEPLAANTYLTQGLLLVTVGLISKFAGLQLALILSVESVLLLVAGQHRKNVVLLTGAYLAAALSVGWGIDSLKQFDAPTLWLGIGLSIIMMANCGLAHRQLAGAAALSTEPESLAIRGQPLYFALLALAVCVAVTWNNTSGELFPLVIATEALVLTFSIYILRIPEVTLLSQGLMLLAQAAWLVNWMDRSHSLPWWNPALIIGVSLALSHWWPRQNVIQRKPANSLIWPALYALAINLVLYCWFVPKNTTPIWLVTTSILALGLTVYGVATRAWFLAAGSQLFILVGVVQFAWQLFQGNAPWQYPLAPIVAMGLLSFGTVFWFAQKPAANPRVREPLLQIALIYRWFGLAMSIAWICQYIPARERIWVLGLLGVGIFIAAGRWRSREALLFSAAFTVTGLAVFWMPVFEAPTVYVPNLLFILGLLAQAEIARRSPDRYPFDANVPHSLIILGGLSLWLFVSRWVLEMANGFYLTASWSVLALGLFSAGLLLRERMYRWLGLGILACALGRVVIFDVWKLEAIYRILSFMALGIVLLVLGFIYSKYQEKIKEWL
jgi:uncharacterized membrane protein